MKEIVSLLDIDLEKKLEMYIQNKVKEIIEKENKNIDIFVLSYIKKCDKLFLTMLDCLLNVNITLFKKENLNNLSVQQLVFLNQILATLIIRLLNKIENNKEIIDNLHNIVNKFPKNKGLKKYVEIISNEILIDDFLLNLINKNIKNK